MRRIAIVMAMAAEAEPLIATLAATEVATPAWAANLPARLHRQRDHEFLDESDVDRARIIESGAEVKDMEAASVAWVARLHQTPASAVKAITDLVDSPVATETQFLANLDLAVERLQSKVLELLPRLTALESRSG